MKKIEIIIKLISAITALLAVFFGSGKIFDYIVSRQAQAASTPTVTATMTLPPTFAVSDTPLPIPSETPVRTLAPTRTAVPSPTATATPLLLPGEDWKQDCISSSIWSFYNKNGEVPRMEEGCYVLLPWGISALDGQLDIFTQDAHTPMTAGIMLPLPTNVSVTFSLDVKSVENADVWMGIAESTSSPIGKYLFAKGDGFFDLMEIERLDYPRFVARYHAYESPTRYRLTLTVEGTKFEVSRAGSYGQMFSPLYIRFAPRYLFLGYRTHVGDGDVKVDVSIYDLVIEPR
jgi:hypothetical protein